MERSWTTSKDMVTGGGQFPEPLVTGAGNRCR